MTAPSDSSSLLAIHRNGRLTRAHVERFACELASYHEGADGQPEAPRGAVMGYSGKAGLILRSVLLQDGQMSLRPPSMAAGASDDSSPSRLGDVAGVMLELAMLGESSLSYYFLATWLEQSGSFSALDQVRTEIDREWSLLARRHDADDDAVERASSFAHERARPDRARGLLITHGPSGSGKTTLATALAGLVGAVLVRSDAELMRAKRHPELFASDPAPGHGAHVERLEMLAEQVVRAGWTVIVEGCFLSRVNRQRFRAKAGALGVPFVILSCSAPLSTVRERLKRRRAFGSLFHGKDASAALVEKQLQLQLRNADPLAMDERASAIQVDTGSQVDHQRLAKQLLELKR